MTDTIYIVTDEERYIEGAYTTLELAQQFKPGLTWEHAGPIADYWHTPAFSYVINSYPVNTRVGHDR